MKIPANRAFTVETENTVYIFGKAEASGMRQVNASKPLFFSRCLIQGDEVKLGHLLMLYYLADPAGSGSMRMKVRITTDVQQIILEPEQ
jgi:hypothetical protein